MTIRSRRRVEQSATLEEMSDEQLTQIRFFGDVIGEGHTVTYTATKEESIRAGKILEERRDTRRTRLN